MAATGDSGRQSWHWLFTGWRGVVTALVVAVMVGLSSTSLLTSLEFNGVLQDRSGRIGTNNSSWGHAPGWMKVGSVVPGGAADAAGIAPGDEIYLGSPLRAYSSYRAGDKLELVVRHEGRDRRTTLVYRQFDPTLDSG